MALCPRYFCVLPLLAACASPLPPTVEVPSAWQSVTEESSAWPSSEWWQAFGNPELSSLIIQAADDFARLSAADDRRFFLARPGPTGSVRWDALLGALAVELCRRYGLETTPGWTRQPDRYLNETWWVGAAGEVETLRALALRDSPPAFRARGVMMGRQILEST